jgi:hypothetical protein
VTVLLSYIKIGKRFHVDMVDKYITRCRNIEYTQTHDRSVLGLMEVLCSGLWVMLIQ